jgi:hypothetical protein
MKGSAMKNAPSKKSRSGVKYPSKASLREMPERRVGTKTKPNKFAAKIAKDGGLEFQRDGEPAQWIPLRQGRPKKGAETEPSKPRAVRLPDTIWSELQARAKKRGVGVHTLLRELVAAFLKKAA